MKLTFYVSGIRVKVSVEPDSLLKEIAQTALSRSGLKELQIKDYTCVCNDIFLNLESTVADQQTAIQQRVKTEMPVSLEDMPIFLIHNSQAHLIVRPVNPYQGKNFF